MSNPPFQADALSVAQPQAPQPSSPFTGTPVQQFLKRQAYRILANGGSEQDVVNYLKHAERLPLKDVLEPPRNYKMRYLFGGALPMMSQIPVITYEDEQVSPELGVPLKVLQGVTFGFGDEALGSLLGVVTGKGAAEGRREYRDVLKTFSEEQPQLAAGSELVGSLLGVGGAIRAVPALAGRTLLGAAGSGALFGGVQAAGNTEGSLSDRARNALFGAEFGAATGLALGALGKVASVFTPMKLRNSLGVGVDQGAENLAAEALQRDGVSIQDAIATVKKRAAAGQATTLADVGGEHTLELAASAQHGRGPLQQQLAVELTQRQSGSGDRLLARLFQQLKPGMRNADDLADVLMGYHIRESVPLFKVAYQHEIPISDQLRSALNKVEPMRNAYAAGALRATTEDLANPRTGALLVPSLDQVLAGNTMPVRAFDYMREQLEQQIANMAPSQARSFRNLLGMLTDNATAMSAPYADALGTFRGLQEHANALQLGQTNFLRKLPHQILAELADLKDPHLQQIYRLGALKSIANALHSTASPDFEAATKMFGALYENTASARLAEQRITALFEGKAPEAVRDFMDFARAEAKSAAVARRAGRTIGGNLQSLLAQQSEGAAPEALAAGSRPGARVARAVGGTVLKLLGQGDAQLRELSDALTRIYLKGLDNPEELVSFLGRLRQGSFMPTIRHVTATARNVAAEKSGGFATQQQF